jgi:hypothetical protein
MITRFLRWLLKLMGEDDDLVFSIQCPGCGNSIWLPRAIRRRLGHDD